MAARFRPRAASAAPVLCSSTPSTAHSGMLWVRLVPPHKAADLARMLSTQGSRRSLKRRRYYARCRVQGAQLHVDFTRKAPDTATSASATTVALRGAEVTFVDASTRAARLASSQTNVWAPFALIVGDSVWVIGCIGDDERHDWITALRQAITQGREHKREVTERRRRILAANHCLVNPTSDRSWRLSAALRPKQAKRSITPESPQVEKVDKDSPVVKSSPRSRGGTLTLHEREPSAQSGDLARVAADRGALGRACESLAENPFPQRRSSDPHVDPSSTGGESPTSSSPGGNSMSGPLFGKRAPSTPSRSRGDISMASEAVRAAVYGEDANPFDFAIELQDAAKPSGPTGLKRAQTVRLRSMGRVQGSRVGTGGSARKPVASAQSLFRRNSSHATNAKEDGVMTSSSSSLISDLNELEVSAFMPTSPSAKPQRVSRKKVGAYNERFQAAISALREFDENTPDQKRLKQSMELITLGEDFVNSARRYGRIIISEVFLPIREKTIAPANLGGVIGGEKYIVNNILFKFAMDRDGLFGGNHASAAKVAGHELKGLKAYFQTKVPGLCYPLMAIIDLKGFRLVAVSLLPLSSTSLIYGSNDAGTTIHDDDAKFNHMMAEAGVVLNLKPHRCGTIGTLMYSCVDLEGHRGTDGRYYVLDFSRTFPPVAPQPGIQGGHLFRLFRPEFIAAYPKPLCPDGFSKFTMQQSDHEEHKTELKEATRDLKTRVIPTYAASLIGQLDSSLKLYKGDITQFRLTESLHSAGINVRYLGAVLRRIKLPSWRIQSYKAFLLTEMIARLVKDELRTRLRRKMEEVQVPIDEPYRKLVVDYLNLLYGTSEASRQYWNKHVVRGLRVKFELHRDNWPEFPSDVRDYVFNCGSFNLRFQLFSRICEMMGLVFARITRELLSANMQELAAAEMFDQTDLLAIGERVKHLDVISNAKGFVFIRRANEKEADGFFVAARYLYERALDAFQNALDASPTDPELLRNCALVLTKIEKLALSEDKGNLFGVHLSLNRPRVARASHYFERAVVVDQLDPANCAAYAHFLEDCQAFDRAEEFYLMALERNPRHIYCLMRYGNFLQDMRKDPRAAGPFFDRAQAVAQQVRQQEQLVQQRH